MLARPRSKQRADACMWSIRMHSALVRRLQTNLLGSLSNCLLPSRRMIGRIRRYKSSTPSGESRFGHTICPLFLLIAPQEHRATGPPEQRTVSRWTRRGASSSQGSVRVITILLSHALSRHPGLTPPKPPRLVIRRRLLNSKARMQRATSS